MEGIRVRWFPKTPLAGNRWIVKKWRWMVKGAGTPAHPGGLTGFGVNLLQSLEAVPAQDFADAHDEP